MQYLRNFAISQPLPHIPERAAHPAAILPLGRIFIVHLNDEARSRSSLGERAKRLLTTFAETSLVSQESKPISRGIFLPGLFKGGPQWIRYSSRERGVVIKIGCPKGAH